MGLNENKNSEDAVKTAKKIIRKLVKMTEDTVTTGNVIKAGKVHYMKKKAVNPIVEAVGGFVDVVELPNNRRVEYNSITKIASYYEGEEVTNRLRCTNSDWDIFYDEVVDQITGVVEDSDEND